MCQVHVSFVFDSDQMYVSETDRLTQTPLIEVSKKGQQFLPGPLKQTVVSRIFIWLLIPEEAAMAVISSQPFPDLDKKK